MDTGLSTMSRWVELFVTLALFAAWLMPFFIPVRIGLEIGLLAFPAVFALAKGSPDLNPLDGIWLALAVVAALLAMLSMVLTGLEYTRDGFLAIFDFDRCGFVNFAVFCIAGFGLRKSYMASVREDHATQQAAQLAAFNEAYQALLSGSEESLTNVDTSRFGYVSAKHEMCYMATRGVVFGTFEDWDNEVSNEIKGALKLSGIGGEVMQGEKTKRVVRTFVEQDPGVMLIFKTRLVFVAPQSSLDIPVRTIKSILWSGWYLIVTVDTKQKPLVFRVPQPQPPWLLAAAITRAIKGPQKLESATVGP